MQHARAQESVDRDLGDDMNVFELRERLISDYSSYIRSFIRIRDERVDALVTSCLDQGRLWPDPLIQLNPSFQYAGTIDDLVAEGVLHSECTRIFRAGKDKGEGKPLRLYQHQADAIRRARAGRNYVLTTGTGSGKSLAYIVPIVDHVLRHGSGRGIQAIVVYPMNALANSQFDPASRIVLLRAAGEQEENGPSSVPRATGQGADTNSAVSRRARPQEVGSNPSQQMGPFSGGPEGVPIRMLPIIGHDRALPCPHDIGMEISRTLA